MSDFEYVRDEGLNREKIFLELSPKSSAITMDERWKGEFLNPGQEMIMRNTDNVGSLERITYEQDWDGDKTPRPRHINKNMGEWVKIDVLLSKEYELELRSKYVFPPWRLYASLHVSDAQIEAAQNPPNTYFLLEVDGRKHLLQPPPFGKYTDIPSYAHPQLLISHAHELTIKRIAAKAHFLFNDNERLFLGNPIDESEKHEAIKAGYVVVQLLDNEVRVVYPSPMVIQDGNSAIAHQRLPRNEGMRDCDRREQDTVCRRLSFE
jgi:hypothetical protein